MNRSTLLKHQSSPPTEKVSYDIDVPIDPADDPVARHVETDLGKRATFIIGTAQYSEDTVSIGTEPIHETSPTPMTEIRAASRSEKDVSDDNYVTGENFAAVCDGVGSSQYGGAASKLVTDYLAEELTDINQLTSRETAVKRVKKILRKAHKLARKEQEETGMSMASTATTLNYIVEDDTTYAVVGNVGDSPAYTVRKGKLREITAWHRKKLPKPAKRPALGKKMDIDPDVHVLRVKPGDTIILTSNGVRKNDQSQKKSNRILDNHSEPSEIARLFTELKGQSHDDSTAVVALCKGLRS